MKATFLQERNCKVQRLECKLSKYMKIYEGLGEAYFIKLNVFLPGFPTVTFFLNFKINRNFVGVINLTAIHRPYNRTLTK